jgi:hypothetical protein
MWWCFWIILFRISSFKKIILCTSQLENVVTHIVTREFFEAAEREKKYVRTKHIARKSFVDFFLYLLLNSVPKSKNIFHFHSQLDIVLSHSRASDTNESEKNSLGEFWYFRYFVQDWKLQFTSHVLKGTFVDSKVGCFWVE